MCVLCRPMKMIRLFYLESISFKNKLKSVNSLIFNPSRFFFGVKKKYFKRSILLNIYIYNILFKEFISYWDLKLLTKKENVWEKFEKKFEINFVVESIICYIYFGYSYVWFFDCLFVICLVVWLFICNMSGCLTVSL